MNASKLITTLAALVFAGSAAAADVQVANASVTSAATVAAAAAQSVTIAQPVSNTREQVRAEAVHAAKQRRATEAGQADWFMK